jgi:hypothetical protein
MGRNSVGCSQRGSEEQLVSEERGDAPKWTGMVARYHHLWSTHSLFNLAVLPDDRPTGGFFDDDGPVPW